MSWSKTSMVTLLRLWVIRDENNVTKTDDQQGDFTEKTFSPLLTVYRVGCMPKTTAVTRRDYGGFDMAVSTSLRTAMPDYVQQDAHDMVKRTNLEASALKQVLTIADQLSSAIDPTNENITVREFRLLEQTNTALFAINIVNSGLPLHEMCDYLRDPGIANNLNDNYIDAQQAGDIVCFAADYGLYFNMTNNQLLSDLAALEYAIQIHAYGSQTLQDLCKTLDYSAASFLGIDTEEIQNTICKGTGGVTHPTQSAMTSTMAPSTTGNNSPIGTHSLGTAASSSASGSSIVFGSNGPTFSSATSAAGTIAPWFNTTTSPMVVETATAIMLTVTAGRDVAPEDTSVAGSNMFYNAPQLRRAELRRHGRAML